jgi:ABC-type uncharacterized transport system permease subunit
MRRVSRILLLTVAAIVIFGLVWSKLGITIRVNVSLWQALLLFGVAVLVLFLILDHFINRNRSGE